MKGIGAGTVYHSRKHEGMIQSKHFEENYLMLTLVSRVVKPDENKKFISNQETIQQWKEIYTANQIEQKTILNNCNSTNILEILNLPYYQLKLWPFKYKTTPLTVLTWPPD